MRTTTIDLIVGPITVLEGEAGNKYTAPLTGENAESAAKLVIKCNNRGVLEELGIEAEGNKVTISISPTNSTLDDFMEG